jgi:hypothetical protein
MSDSQTHDGQGSPDDAAAERGCISITHTNEDGTLVHGTERGDGSRDALKLARFRWSRNLGAWFMPQSRGRAARRERIDMLVAGLQRAGFKVELDIEQYDAAQAFAALQAAGEERGERLAERSERERGRGDARSQAAHQAVAGIPFGQPILVGHHSERHHRAAIDRADRNMAAAVDHHRNADSAAERSEAAQRQAARREHPVVMGRKMERLEAEERSLKRILATATSDYADRMRERLAVVEEELRFLRQAIQDSGVRQYTHADFKPGDLARIRGRWHVVAKANAKTIAVETGYSWTDKYPYHEVTEQRNAADAARHADAI